MTTMTAGATALFKMDDSDNPGLARVKLLKKKERESALLPWNIWQVEVLEIVKPSPWRNLKVGKRMTAGEKHLTNEL